MPRSKGGQTSIKRRNKFAKLAEGYRGVQKSRYHMILEAIFKAGRHSYIDRRRKKREFRVLWIQRINAAVRLAGMPYNQFMHGLHKAGISLDRKSLADLAMNQPAEFNQLVEIAKTNLG